MILSVNRKC